MMLIQAAIFAGASAAILPLSWRSLKAPRSHGFYRFFAFELIVALVVWNAPEWFRNPLCARQILSWMLLVSSIFPALAGFRLLRGRGRPSREPSTGAQLQFESTTVLVSTGIYRYIRHPMYASLVALAWGACLKDPGAVAIALALAATAFLTATALAEERENLARFGSAYAAYMRGTRRFVPLLF
jgi:protein-S-isoprenylcysteine O-methyltransferase Ste14